MSSKMLIARRNPICSRDIVVLAKVSKLHSLMMAKSPYPAPQPVIQGPEMPLAFIPLLLIVVPLLEIAAFIAVGSRIGILPTIGLVLISALCGVLLLRAQGLATFARIRSELDSGRMPGKELADAIMILAAAVLLLTPGFVTDALGFTLMVPAVRAAIFRRLAARTIVFPSGPGHYREGSAAKKDVIDLGAEEFSAHESDGRDPSRSPWKPS
jgi:UPF0716 protein FxsA